MEQVQCVSKSSVLVGAVCSLADGALMVPVVCREVSEGQTMVSAGRIPIVGNRHSVGKQRGEHIPQARVAFIFCPSRTVGKVPHCASGHCAWHQGKV